MNPEYIYCEQRSEEWFRVRLGIVTASHFSKVLNKGSGRKTYMMKLLAEINTGEPEIDYHNKYMENGTETEPSARKYYESLKKVKVEQVGFVKLGEIGASPDSLVGDDGGLEIKCPLPSTHLGYIIDKKLPTIYIPQIQGNMLVTGRKWWDFLSFNPLCKPAHWCIRVKRDERYINNILQSKIDEFLYELKTLKQKIEIPF